MIDDTNMDMRQFLWQLVRALAQQGASTATIMLQAYFDDSKDGRGEKYLVLAGYLSEAETWMKFSQEWEELLSMRPPMKAFKLSSFNLYDEIAAERVRHFYRLIERYELPPICVGVPVDVFYAVCEAIRMPEFLRNPYVLAFVGVHNAVASYAKYKGLDRKCELIFDQQDDQSAS
ncbi:MAG: hypothetical protein JWL86_5996, partial [Rhizobium sp.]|nr:hypothetical protein [Rhizobium sp.]